MADIDVLHSFIHALNEGAKTGDYKKALAHFTSNARIVSFLGVQQGKKAIADYFSDILPDSTIVVRRWAEEGDVLTAYFEVEAAGQPAGGGKYSLKIAGDKIASLTVEVSPT